MSVPAEVPPPGTLMEKPTNDGVGVLPDLARGGELAKTLTGIQGLDEITRGGLPKGRPTLVCGGPGIRQDAAGHHLPGERRRPVSTNPACS